MLFIPNEGLCELIRLPILVKPLRPHIKFSLPQGEHSWKLLAGHKKLRVWKRICFSTIRTFLVLMLVFGVVPSLKLTVRTWKWMVGIRSFPFWDGLFSGAHVSFQGCISFSPIAVDAWFRNFPSHSDSYIWVFPEIKVPQNGWFIMENPIKMDDLGVPLFSETLR